jgi:CubicO group peptidase (beta-lactamase class C family)
MKRSSFLFTLAACAAGLMCAWPAVAAPDARQALAARSLLPPTVTESTKPMRIEDRLRHYRVPGVAVAVVDDGRLAWAAGWGVAQSGRPGRPGADTLFQVGSISKAVAALGALKLVEAGSLPLEADIAPRLRGWTLPAGAQTAERPVTLAGLLSHSAGLSVGGFPGFAVGQPVASLPQVLDGVAPAVTPPVRVVQLPGQAWRYSGGGYVLMQLLMDEATGEPFERWMQREVIAAAGLRDSTYSVLSGERAARAAAGHETREPEPDKRVPIVGLRRVYPEQAAAGLHASAADIARLSVHLQAVLAGEPGAVSKATLEQALKPRIQGPGFPMGLGFFLDDSGRALAYGHNGSNQGFESTWRFDRRRAIVVMSNSNGAGPLMDEIVRGVAVAHGWSDLLPQRMDRDKLQARFDSTPVFVRGSFNNWAADLPLQRGAAGRYAAEVELPAGKLEFKFGAADWQGVNLGADFVTRGPASGGALGEQGRNLQFIAPSAGRYRFELDTRQPEAPRYRVQRIGAAAPPA